MIYLLGGSGYVGAAYRRLLLRRGLPFVSLSRSTFDYTDAASLTGLLRRERPRFLINAAGYSGKPNVDACERAKADCLFANAVLPGRIAQACAAASVPWGHVSSGCIFNGGSRRFREDDPPNFTFRSPPCSFYSGTKALGEEVLEGHPQTYIWRLRMPFTEIDGSRNYLSKIMRYERLLDATNSLSQLDEFCDATLACWERRVPFGVYHVTNPGHMTTREVTKLMRDVGLLRRDFTFFASEADLARITKAPRANCILDSSKLAAAGIAMTEVHEAVERALRRWRSDEVEAA